MLTFFIGIYEKYEKIVFWKFPESRVRLIRFGTVKFLHRCEAPPKLSATQTYGQGPAGTLTIGFEEQVKV